MSLRNCQKQRRKTLSCQISRPAIHDSQDDARYAFNRYGWLLAAMNGHGARRIHQAA
jgi:hypothetical protein